MVVQWAAFKAASSWANLHLIATEFISVNSHLFSTRLGHENNMDGLSGASGVLAVVSVAIQLLESINKLCVPYLSLNLRFLYSFQLQFSKLGQKCLQGYRNSYRGAKPSSHDFGWNTKIWGQVRHIIYDRTSLGPMSPSFKIPPLHRQYIGSWVDLQKFNQKSMDCYWYCPSKRADHTIQSKVNRSQTHPHPGTARNISVSLHYNSS